MATKISIELPGATTIRTLASGEQVKLQWDKLPAHVVAAICEGGAKIILTNAYNGGGKDKTEGEKEAQLQKRLDAWYRGEYVQVERGESQFTAMREQYYSERLEAAGQTRAQVDKQIKALVAQQFGEKEAATFSRFLDAVAKVKAKAAGTEASAEREAIETALAKRTAEAAAKRAELASKIDVEMDLGF